MKCQRLRLQPLDQSDPQALVDLLKDPDRIVVKAHSDEHQHTNPDRGSPDDQPLQGQSGFVGQRFHVDVDCGVETENRDVKTSKRFRREHAAVDDANDNKTEPCAVGKQKQRHDDEYQQVLNQWANKRPGANEDRHDPLEIQLVATRLVNVARDTVHVAAHTSTSDNILRDTACASLPARPHAWMTCGTHVTHHGWPEEDCRYP